MSMTEPSGLLKLTELGVNMQHKICDACETVAHCTNHGCIPITQLRAAEGHGPSGPAPLTYEEMLHELWYLRRRVRQLEQQISNQSQEQ